MCITQRDTSCKHQFLTLDHIVNHLIQSNTKKEETEIINQGLHSGKVEGALVRAKKCVLEHNLYQCVHPPVEVCANC